jgi:hypothetical protein
LASEAHRGRAIGLYYLIRGLCVMPAPLIGGLLGGIAPRLPFLAGFAAMAAGTLAFIGWGPAETPEPDPCVSSQKIMLPKGSHSVKRQCYRELSPPFLDDGVLCADGIHGQLLLTSWSAGK